MLFWVYLIMLVLGGGLLIASWIVGEFSEAAEGMFGWIDGALESIEIDLIPDSLGDGVIGQGLGYGLTVFMVFFGAVGLITTAVIKSISVVGSLAVSIFVAGLAGFSTLLLVRYLKQGETGNAPVDDDYIGARGHVSLTISQDGLGIVLVQLRGQVVSLRAKSETGEKLEQGALITIVQKGGSVCIVKRSESGSKA